MAFDKAKVLKNAEKFLSQGKINAAIKEYRQIVDNDSDDLTALNMLGDLYVRANKKEEAARCFGRLDGLVNNASSFYSTPFGKISEREWQDLIGTNLRARRSARPRGARLLRASGCSGAPRALPRREACARSSRRSAVPPR